LHERDGGHQKFTGKMRGHADADLHAMKNRFSRADDAAPDRTSPVAPVFAPSPAA